MKKVLALILAVLAVASIFAGCTGNGGPVGPGNLNLSGDLYPVDENGNFIYGDAFKGQKVTMWVGSNFDLNEDMFFFKKIEEVIGCDLEITFYPYGEVFTTKVSNALATNSLPDIIPLSGVELSSITAYGDQGAFVNLMDPAVLERMPNFKRVIVDNPEAFELFNMYTSTTTGGNYITPTWELNRAVNYGWMYRKDIFEKHNIPMWTDTESFLSALRALKAAYPNSYPMTGFGMNSVWERMMSSFGEHNHTVMAYDWDASKWYCPALSATEDFYSMIKTFQTAYNEDLIDPDILTNTDVDIDSAVTNNNSFVFNSWIGRMSVQNAAGKEKNPDFQVSYANHIGNGMGLGLSKFTGGQTCINAQAQNVEACIAIVDWLYSEEGAFAMSIGEEGKTFKMVDGERVYIDASGNELKAVTIEALEEHHGMWNVGYYKVLDKSSCYYDFTPEEAEAQEIGVAGGVVPARPAVVVDPDLAQDYWDMGDALNTEINSFIGKFVTQNYSREQFDNWVANLHAKYDRLFDDILNK